VEGEALIAQILAAGPCDIALKTEELRAEWRHTDVLGPPPICGDSLVLPAPQLDPMSYCRL